MRDATGAAPSSAPFNVRVYSSCSYTVLMKCYFFLSVNLLQMLDLNVTIAFPAAPLFTVILSLVGKLICLNWI